jgi:hypothetical protein
MFVVVGKKREGRITTPTIMQPATAAMPAVEEVEGVDTWPYCYLY